MVVVNVLLGRAVGLCESRLPRLDACLQACLLAKRAESRIVLPTPAILLVVKRMI